MLANWDSQSFTAAFNLTSADFVANCLDGILRRILSPIGSLVGYLGLLDLGIREIVTRFIVKIHAQEDHVWNRSRKQPWVPNPT